MKLFRKLAMALALAALLPTLLVAATGEIENYRGNVTIRLKTGDGLCLNGAELRLYRVGRAAVQSGGLVFENTVDVGIPLDGLSAGENGEAAQKLLTVIQNTTQTSTDCRTDATNSKGEARFADLQNGVYLVEQRTTDSTKQWFQPFLLYLPQEDRDGSWLTEVIVSPKMEPEKPAEPTNPPKPGGKLPQTGMVQWPVPVLALGGLACIVLGLTLSRREDQ